ncbi:MAG: hypothetical protein CTY16_12155 [Methylobacter sp.]|uniref:hypothetical protein n=1 Tax=Methylovulum miyakonense TaxID=645578 RepID=UPI00036F85CC|nr:hypothetical protein [Methylovulum miyakonense]PPD44232.1 MAG: hypothetical protein CTY16_12155 [Methylobacter sp.]
MIGTITAFLIAYWFYKKAEATGKNPLSAAGLGFLSYLIPCMVWTLTVTPGLRDAVDHNPGTLSGLIVNYAYILVGAACAIGIKFLHFKPSNVTS